MADDDNVLFLRENDSSVDEDIWDDTALIKAYDKAVNLAKEEVARRIAMDTQSEETKQKAETSKKLNSDNSITKWAVGFPCRAVYSEDGQVYEAIILKIYENSGMCVVKFIGYGNTEKVELSSLLESNGLQSQIAQHKETRAEENTQTAVDSDTPINFTRWSKHFKQSREKMDYDTENSKLPGNEYMSVPFFNSATDAVPPAPPLPPQLIAKLPENDADALSSMLMSWYVSGFHTGYYHGLRQGKINQDKRRNH